MNQSGWCGAYLLAATVVAAGSPNAWGQTQPDAPPRTKVVFKETVIGKTPPGKWKMFDVDRNRRHLVVVVDRDGKDVVYRDGTADQPYDKVLMETVRGNADFSRVAYVARQGRKYHVVVNGVASKEYDDLIDQSLRFSRDGKHLTYSARQGLEQFVVIDGVQGPSHEVVWPIGVLFSPDSQQTFYGVTDGWKMAVVVDGVCGPRHEAAFNPRFSPDSKSVAYAAYDKDRQYRIVVNGQEGPPAAAIYMESPFFTPDNRAGYGVCEPGKDHYLVLGGVPGPKVCGVRELPVFSEDGRHHVYPVYTSKQEMAVVVDGVVQKSYSVVFNLRLSPDGRRVAYGTYRKGDARGIMVVDGKELFELDAISPGTPVFSPDSKHVLFGGERDDQRLFVLDGVDIPRRWGMSPAAFSLDEKAIQKGDKRILCTYQSACFSPDGKHYAYVSADTDGQFIVIDGVPGKRYGFLAILPAFTPDSKHIVYVALSGHKECVVVDDAESRWYDRNLGAQRNAVIDSPTRFHKLAIADEMLYWVDGEIQD